MITWLKKCHIIHTWEKWSKVESASWGTVDELLVWEAFKRNVQYRACSVCNKVQRRFAE